MKRCDACEMERDWDVMVAGHTCQGGERMKPLDETWTANEYGRVQLAGGGEILGDAYTDQPEMTRARLAAQAPAMARMLARWLEEGDMDPDAVREALRAAGVVE